MSEHIIHTGSNAPRITCSDIQYEFIFVLMTYAYACSLQANDTLKDPTKTAVLYTKATGLLNTAASVFSYVANDVIPTWRPPSDTNRPVETIRELAVALSK